MTRPKRHYRNMNRAKVNEIRRRYFLREATQAALGREYGIAQNTVSRIVSGITWAQYVR